MFLNLEMSHPSVVKSPMFRNENSFCTIIGVLEHNLCRSTTVQPQILCCEGGRLCFTCRLLARLDPLLRIKTPRLRVRALLLNCP